MSGRWVISFCQPVHFSTFPFSQKNILKAITRAYKLKKNQNQTAKLYKTHPQYFNVEYSKNDKEQDNEIFFVWCLAKRAICLGATLNLCLKYSKWKFYVKFNFR